MQAVNSEHAMRSRSMAKERGFVLVWTAVLLTVLLLMAALAVDLGFWYRNKNHTQQAADAAAAAGVIYRSIGGSDDFAAAERAAKQAASANGFQDAEILVSRTNEDTGVLLPANQLYVRITRDSPNFFLSIIGMDRSTVTARSIAEYEAPLALGSPSNALGRQPGSSDWTTGSAGAGQTSSLWLDVHGPSTPVHSGDQYSSINCATIVGRIPDVCTGSAGPTVNESHETRGRDGYTYILRVLPGGEGRPITLQAFDPAFTDTSSQCDSNSMQTLGRLVTAYNTQSREAYEANTRIRDSINNRLFKLIGGYDASFITNPAVNSELWKLRQDAGPGGYGTRIAPANGYFYGFLQWRPEVWANDQWRREREISTPIASWPAQGLQFYDNPISGGTTGLHLPFDDPLRWVNQIYSGVYNFSHYGTYYVDGAVFPGNIATHGDVPNELVDETPAASIPWNQQHDSAYDLIALRQRVLSALGTLVEPTTIPNTEIYATGPWSAAGPSNVEQFCAGDSSFGTQYVPSPPNPTPGPPCPGCNPNSLRSTHSNRNLEQTASLPSRPATRFRVMKPGTTSDLVDSNCDDTFGGFTEKHSKDAPHVRGDLPLSPQSGAGATSELFRILSRQLGLKWVKGMDPLFWNGLIDDNTGVAHSWAGNPYSLSLTASGQLDQPNTNDKVGDSTGTHDFLSTFHKWVPLCRGNTFVPPQAGDYRIVVDSNAQMNAIGANRFSLRAAQFDSPLGPGQYLQLFAKDRMNLFLNFSDAGSPTNSVFMTRVLPASYDRLLELNFHDPGDIRICITRSRNHRNLLGVTETEIRSACAPTGATAQLSWPKWNADGTPVLGPAGCIPLINCVQLEEPGEIIDATRYSLKLSLFEYQGALAAGTPLSSCQWAKGLAPSSWNSAANCELPAPLASSSDGFQASGTGNVTNGTLLTIRVPLKSASSATTAYDCNPSDFGGVGCWIKARYSFGGTVTTSDGGTFTVNAEDATTWTATLKGDPLRYVGS